jgi:hypothetical protein
MSEIAPAPQGQSGETRPAGRPLSKVWIAVRIGFAVIALGVVIHSIQFHDYVVGKGEKRRIIEKSENTFRTVDPTGHELVVDRSSLQSAGLTYQPGAITLVRGMQGRFVLYAFLLFGGVPLLQATRWRTLLRIQQITIPFRVALKLTYAGLFSSFFLVGTTSGDFVKAYWLGRLTSRKTETFVSVFMDRLVGVSVVIVLAGVIVLALWRDPQVASLTLPVGMLMVGLIVCVVVLFSSRLRRLIRFDRWSGKLPLSSLIGKVDRALLACRRNPQAILRAAGVTAGLQLLSSTSAFCLGQGLQIGGQIWHFWFYVPLAFLVGSIPVSVFWGLGLLEGAYVALFAGSGLASVTQAAMLAMSVRLVQLSWALPGSYVLMSGLDLPEPATVTE